MSDLSDDKLREMLDDEQYHVTQQCGTEPPFTGKYWDHKEAGAYHCVCCGLRLFDSKTKFDSGSGWPSYFDACDGTIATREDNSLARTRTEILCAKCSAHLGHVFNDGPPPTGLRYCVNSASLAFVPEKKD